MQQKRSWIMRVREGVPVVRNRVGKGNATARMQGARHREPPGEIYFSRMLKKSLFSPAQPRRAETRLVPCSVLASFRPSTGTRPPHHSAARTDLVLLIRRTVRPRGYASALRSLRPCWTAFLSILREHSPFVPTCGLPKFSRANMGFPQPARLSSQNQPLLRRLHPLTCQEFP